MEIMIKKTSSEFFGEWNADKGIKDYHHFDIIADGITVGAIAVIDNFNEDNDICYIDRIDVDEEFRGKGIGTVVLTESLKDEGYWKIALAPDNERARKLYERLGEENDQVYKGDGEWQDFSYNDQGYGIYVI